MCLSPTVFVPRHHLLRAAWCGVVGCWLITAGCNQPNDPAKDRRREATLCSKCEGTISPYIMTCPLCGAEDPTGYYDVSRKAQEPVPSADRASRAAAREKQRRRAAEEIRKAQNKRP